MFHIVCMKAKMSNTELLVNIGLTRLHNPCIYQRYIIVDITNEFVDVNLKERLEKTRVQGHYNAK